MPRPAAPRRVSLPSRAAAALALLLLGAACVGLPPSAVPGPGRAGGQPRLLPTEDPVVRRGVAAVRAERLASDLTALVGFGTRHTRSDTASDSRGIGAARRWLAARMHQVSDAHDGRLVVTTPTHVIGPGRRMPEPTEVVNVVGTIPGRDPHRVLVVSGHYDSRNSSDADASGDAPGANDDGSGTVAVLEAARAVLAALGERVPQATLRFAAVAGEEQGLYGSTAMAAADREAGLDVVMITNDIVGGVAGGNGRHNRGLVRLFSEGVPSSEEAPAVVGSDNDAPSRQLARYVQEAAARYVPSLTIELVFRQDRYLRGGDHRAYNARGYPAVRFTDMYEHFDRQHQDVRVEEGRAYGDTIEHIDFQNLADVTRVNVAALLSLALAPPPPREVGVDVAGLSHDTRLLWRPPGSGDVAGYRIRVRPTWSPVWTHVVDVGDVTEHVLAGLSKDDLLFAVEAYDDRGRTSLPVYPEPQR